MLEYLQSILDQPWKPVPRPALIAWLLFYCGFLTYAASARGGFLFIDSANLIVHEGGHNLFGWFGPTLGLWGGTLLQWLVPLLLAAYFFGQHQITGFVFCLFFFFENWLYTATYMADARAQILPLVTTGDPDFVEHDFHAIFSHLGVLNYDTRIAAVVRILGWCGMLAVLVWFTVQGWKAGRELKQGADFSVLSRFTAQRKPLQVPLFSDREKSEPATLQADHSEITNAPNLR